jgi:hypothetical protein
MKFFTVNGQQYRKEITAEDVKLLVVSARVFGNKHLCLSSKQILNDTELRKIKNLYPVNYGRKIGDKFIWTFII